jgi:uncharacterized protein (DUF2336 family)
MSVAAMRAQLTDSDIRTLIKGPVEAERAQAAHKLCRRIGEAELSVEERTHAEAIIAILAQDAAVLVRQALAEALQNSPSLPRGVASQLARDVETVALPVIRNSPALSDGDLVEIVRACAPGKQMAVASRTHLSAAVTGALAQCAPADAVEKALANDNALFDEEALAIAIERFDGVPGIIAAMAHRRALPIAIAGKLAPLADGEVFDHLVNNHELPAQVAVELAMGARERATLDIVEQAGRQRDLARFVHELNLNGRLTPSLLMRGLCLGHIGFVEHALAELSGISHQRMCLLLHDSGPVGLKAAFDRAKLPPRLYPSFRAAVEVYHSIERENPSQDGASLRRRMLERMLTLFQSVPKDDLDYLMAKLDGSGDGLAPL